MNAAPMEGYPEPLETIFRKVEQESERRAQQESYASEVPTEVSNAEPSTGWGPRTRQRAGSVTVTRIGQASAENVSVSSDDESETTAASAFSRTGPNDSTASFASGTSAQDHTEAETHVTQVREIAGRQSISMKMGNLLPRRLSRTSSILTSPPREANMIIGVSVEEATIEGSEGAEGTPTTIVHGPNRTPTSSSSPERVSPTTQTWSEKAKIFTRKFRRRMTKTSR